MTYITVYDCISGDFTAKNTSHTPCIYGIYMVLAKTLVILLVAYLFLFDPTGTNLTRHTNLHKSAQICHICHICHICTILHKSAKSAQICTRHTNLHQSAQICPLFVVPFVCFVFFICQCITTTPLRDPLSVSSCWLVTAGRDMPAIRCGWRWKFRAATATY